MDSQGISDVIKIMSAFLIMYKFVFDTLVINKNKP